MDQNLKKLYRVHGVLHARRIRSGRANGDRLVARGMVLCATKLDSALVHRKPTFRDHVKARSISIAICSNILYILAVIRNDDLVQSLLSVMLVH